MGHRCMARGLSDLAAMGAKSDGGFSVFGAAAGDAGDQFGDGAWVAGFFKGLRSAG